MTTNNGWIWNGQEWVVADPNYPQRPQVAQVNPALTTAAQTGPPQVVGVDASVMEQAIADAAAALARANAARSGTGGSLNDRVLKFLGPNGESDWKNLDIGFERRLRIRILPSNPPGQMPFSEEKRHKIWDGGRTTYCACNGDEACFIHAAQDALYKAGNKDLAKRVTFDRQFLMQGILVEDYASHQTADGKLTPWIVRMRPTLKEEVFERIKKRTVFGVTSAEEAHDITLVRKKTGRDVMDIKYTADDEDLTRLHHAYYPIYENLFDFSKIIKPSTYQQQLEFIQKAGWPVPPTLAQYAQAEAQQQNAAPQQGAPPTQQQPQYAAQPGPHDLINKMRQH